MKLTYKSIEEASNETLYVNRISEPHQGSNWHFHEEFELFYSLHGEGIRIAGDNISHFQSPELALVGPRLPHLWKNTIHSDGKNKVDFIVIKFNSTLSRQDVFSIPEFSNILTLLNESLKGLLFGRKAIGKVHNHMLNLVSGSGADRLISFLLVLKHLSESEDYKVLASPEFTQAASDPHEKRLKNMIYYISRNYTRLITIQELSEIAAMTPNSLHRFFKNRTNNTLFQFINKFRIGEACRLLINGEDSITEICYKSGFGSLTTFNRVFKKYKGLPPKAFKEKYRKLES